MSLVVWFVLLAVTIPLAHIVGRLVAGHAHVDAGHIREAMPSLPAAPPLQGSAERRWDKRLSQLERKLLHEFKDGATHIEAGQLAAKMGEDPLLVDAALTRMREEIPVRMKIMGSGRIYHDFKAQDIQELTRRRARSWPRQLFLTGLAAFANIGAAWPVLSVAGISAFALFGMSTGEEPLAIGIMGLMGAVAVMVTTLISGFLAQILFTPFRGPRLGDAKSTERLPELHAQFDPTVTHWAFIDTSYGQTNAYASSSWWDDDDSSSGGSFDLDLGESGEGALIIIVAALLLAILGASLSLVWLWLRGVYRAIQRLGEPQASTSPTIWVRTADIIDRWEKFIPNNDLVLRTLHALKRFFDHRRPTDDGMAARTLTLAKHRGGVVSGLELALREGLDLNEANEVGARLCGLLGGRIMVSEEGELAFAFPQRLLSKINAAPDDDMFAEYITFSYNNVPRRRHLQREYAVPVNLVGLTKGHLLASDRLVAGTYIMAAMGAVLLTGLTSVIPLTLLPLAPLLLVMALGTASLNATARYTAREAAAQGIRRDIRRATFHHIHHSLPHHAHVDMGPLTSQLLAVFRPSWSGLTEDMVAAEVRGVCHDLDISIALNQGGREVYDLRPLRKRLDALHNFSAVFEEDEFTFDFDQTQGEDEVVFDTQIQHDHVTVVGRV